MNKQLRPAVLYYLWSEQENLDAVTAQRYGAHYARGLQRVVLWHQRSQVQVEIDALMREQFWTRDDLYAQAKHVLVKLSDRLQGGGWLCGTSEPMPADAVLFAYLHTVLSTKMPQNQLAEMIKLHPNLVDFTKQAHAYWFDE
jgi:hypothetical protein